LRLDDSPEEAAWRAEVADFVRREMPASVKVTPRLQGEDVGEWGEVKGTPAPMAGGSGFRPHEGDMALWRDKLAARGWIAPAWPEQYGGAGLSIMEQFIMAEEFAEAGAPQLGGMGVAMVGPTLITHGTDEQRAEHLPQILRGEVHWCQGFSEPGSGSDLASLQTRAVRDGDDYLINGQKIWTSGAHHANWMFLLARTDPEAPKHRGISFFLMDFSTPGITVQPLVNMGSAMGFNQVFFDNVRVPARNLVGDENRGWYVGTTTLDFERSGIGSSVNTRKNVNNLLSWASEHRNDPACGVARNPVVRNELVERYIEVNVQKMLSYRVIDMQNRGLIPNAEASLTKLFTTELIQRIGRTASRMAGMYGQIWEATSPYAPFEGEFARAHVNSVGQTLAGGTSEIQRNIIAQRGLGMPRS
jgi:alkylation response protein AidB-like acyl-CoA dehydrogenase